MTLESFGIIVLVVGSLIVLLLIMAIISWWRRGSKYARLEATRREQNALGDLAERRKYAPSGAKFTDWDIQADLDDPPHE